MQNRKKKIKKTCSCERNGFHFTIILIFFMLSSSDFELLYVDFIHQFLYLKLIVYGKKKS